MEAFHHILPRFTHLCLRNNWIGTLLIIFLPSISLAQIDSARGIPLIDSGQAVSIEGKRVDSVIYVVDGSVWTSFYENGHVKSEGKFSNSYHLKTGRWKYFHPDGQLKAIGKYKYGHRVGKWKFFSPKEILIDEIDYGKDAPNPNSSSWHFPVEEYFPTDCSP